MPRFYKRTALHRLPNRFSRGVISLLLIKRFIAITFIFSFLAGGLVIGFFFAVFTWALRSIS